MQYASRREARAAEAARAAQTGSELDVIAATSHELVAVEPRFVATPAPEVVATSVVPVVPIAPVSEAAAIVVPAASVSVALESHTVTPSRARQPRAVAARPAARAAASTSPAQPRKNPLSVLATMAVVGGLFAVAGLPAYAVSSPDAVATTAAVSNVDSQSVAVLADVASATPIRDAFTATTAEDLAASNADALRAEQNAIYLASGARELGDDYPWPFELRDYQGGGLSPLNYYYRECVDFVAWRLNRDAGSYSAPFKYVWSNLTPYGGNGGQWMSNWQALGRTVSNVPIAGSVAYVGANHVAYVESVNADGSVNLEEYNYIPGAYSKRTMPASSIVAFLYPPG